MTIKGAYIVWNADKTEGVIFVDDGGYFPGIQTPEQDAYQALTGERYATATSVLAGAFHDTYEEDERHMVEITADTYRQLL